jgi:hypothetical protein
MQKNYMLNQYKIYKLEDVLAVDLNFLRGIDDSLLFVIWSIERWKCDDEVLSDSEIKEI